MKNKHVNYLPVCRGYRDIFTWYITAPQAAPLGCYQVNISDNPLFRLNITLS